METRPTEMILVRHGETEWNVEGRMQGHLNSPLTERGRQQAFALADHFAPGEITRIVSSDLGRCLETVTPLAGRIDLEIETDSGLRERNLGMLQGLTRKEAGRRPRGEAADFDFSDPDFLPEGGETLREVFSRTTGAVQAIALRHPGERVLVVTHGGVLKCLFHRAVGLPIEMPRRFSIHNAALNRIHIQGDLWTLDSWGLRLASR